MARRGMTGQLNMFDFFRKLETNIPQDGELEMVSLMPSFEEDEIPVSSVKSEPVAEVVVEVEEATKTEEGTKTEVIPEIISEYKSKKHTPKTAKRSTENITENKTENIDKSHDHPVMQRTYTTKHGIVEIAYMNYSKVRVTKPGEEVQIREFASSKEAVDYYVVQMQKLEETYTLDK